jgi:twitching motility protein PilT
MDDAMEESNRVGRQASGQRRLAGDQSASRSAVIDPWLKELWDRQGTDLLLTAGAAPLMRIDGRLEPIVDVVPLTPKQVDGIVDQVLGEELAATFDFEGEVDFSFSWNSQARFRGNAFRQRHSSALALRLIPFQIPTFDDLGLPSVVHDLVNLPHGLVLVTGPTGSGKSTTLASMIEYINENRACHIITIEDPIEYLHQHKKAAVNQREIGEDSISFERALKSVLREDPDVLLLGEMRDLESIAAALTVAETGHLVFATLHTNDTAQALDRIVDVFPSDRRPQIQVQLAHVLAAVIYQRLLPRREGGLVAAFEIMLGNHAVRNLVREGKTGQLRNVVATHQSEGMRTLEMDLSRLVADGTVTLEAAQAVSLHPREIQVPNALSLNGGVPLARSSR